MQREESPAMPTGLERIAAKARCEPTLRFTSIAHPLTKERGWGNLCQILSITHNSGRCHYRFLKMAMLVAIIFCIRDLARA